MDRISIKEFKDKSNIEIIKELMKRNNGYITSRELDMFEIHRMYLLNMKKRGLIKKVAAGIYIDKDCTLDDYYIFSLSMPNVIYSHMTALYLQGFNIKVKNGIYDITVRRTYNSAHLRKHNVFYISDEFFELGLIETETSIGNKVKSYDIERCICDIIRSKNRMNIKDVKHCIKEYMNREDKDLNKLYTYAYKLGIKESVVNYVKEYM